MGHKTGMLPYRVEVADDEAAVTAYAGLPLVLETMRTLGVSEHLDVHLGIRQRNGGATDAQKAEALVLLLAAGGTCLSDINKLRADKSECAEVALWATVFAFDLILTWALPLEALCRPVAGISSFSRSGQVCFSWGPLLAARAQAAPARMRPQLLTEVC